MATPLVTPPGPRVTPIGWSPLRIAEERCKGCALCVAICPPRVLALQDDRVNVLGHHPVTLLDAARCTSCALCARICPDAVFDVFAAPRGVGR